MFITGTCVFIYMAVIARKNPMYYIWYSYGWKKSSEFYFNLE